MTVYLRLAAMAVFVTGCASSPPEVRVVNGTGVPLTAVEVEYGWDPSPEARWRIDSLGGADSTEYRPLRGASPLPHVRARHGDRALEAQPQDRMGESALEPGRYSYILRLAGADDLIVVLQREP